MTRGHRLGWSAAPRRLGRGDSIDSSLQFIDKKLSISRGPRLQVYSRPLFVRRTDQQNRFVWAAPDATESRPAPSRKAQNGAAVMVPAPAACQWATEPRVNAQHGTAARQSR